ncbi:hypothetical protein [Hyphomonas sp.]|jgi:hypothetical protein|uniref:hypothetical protein n=1 Tax=Hyphomonas sp. TaxID=87 RepID=UPI0032D92337
MSHFSLLPENAASTDVWSTEPDLLKAWRTLPRNVMAKTSELSRDEKALIAAYYASLKGFGDAEAGEFPLAEALGLDVKVDQSLFQQVLNDPETAAVDQKLVPLLLYVRKLALESYKLLQRDADKVFSAGWSERAFTDAIIVCATVMFFVSVMIGHGITETKLEDFGGAAAT